MTVYLPFAGLGKIALAEWRTSAQNNSCGQTIASEHTVEILIMHIVIMHNSHNALSFRGSRVGIRGKWVNIAYCIMHEVSGSIMHYEDTLYRG